MPKINMTPKTKKNLLVFLTFFGIVLLFTIILISFTLLSRNSWKNGLAKEMQAVLDDYSPASYTVGTFLPVNSTVSTCAAVYSLIKKDNFRNESFYGVMIRIPSILGPLPVVFIYDGKSSVNFAGYAVDNGKASDTANVKNSSIILSYWEKKIPEIVATAQAK